MQKMTSASFDTAIELQTINAKADGVRTPRFSMHAYTGGLLNVEKFNYPVVIELKSAEFENDQTDINRFHDPERELGHSENQRIDASGIYLDGLLSHDNDDTREIVKAHKAGKSFRASVEAKFPPAELIPPDKTVSVNGQTFNGPVYVARDSLIHGVAILTRAADNDSQVRIAAMEKAQKGAAGENTGSQVRFEIQRLMDSGWTLEEIGNEVDRSGGTLSSIRNGEIKNPPEQLLTDLRLLKSKERDKMNPEIKAEIRRLKGAGVSYEQMAYGNETLTAGMLEDFFHDNVDIADIEEDIEALEMAVLEYLKSIQPEPEAAMASAANSASGIVQTLRANAAGEQTRLVGIQSLCAEHGQPEVGLEAINGGWSEEKTKNVLLEKKIQKLEAGSPSMFNVHATNNEANQTHVQSLEASLAMNTFQVPQEYLGKKYNDQVLNNATSSKYRVVGIQHMLHELCAAAGMPYSGTFKTADAFQHVARAQQALNASATTTMNVSSMFESSINSSLLSSFEGVPTTYQDWCKIGTLTDLKAHKRYRLTASGYKRVGHDGEIHHAKVTESARSIEGDTHGIMLSITRKMIINDDIGALVDLAQQVGRDGAQAVEQMAYEVLLNNDGAFFAAANGNLLTGANTALDYGSLSQAKTQFRRRKNASGQLVNVAPGVMIVPSLLETEAEDLMTAERLEIGTSTKNKEVVINNFRGKYKVSASAYLDDTDALNSNGDKFPNQSATGWYLATDPKVSGMAVAEIGFLNGVRQPFVETQEASFEKLAFEWRSYFDFGGALIDSEAGIFMAGA